MPKWPRRTVSCRSLLAAALLLTLAEPEPRADAQATDVAIHQIQGTGGRSPYLDASVATEGVVTALTRNGFFLQTPDDAVDGDASTSEGIFVFTSRQPAAPVAVGAQVAVRGDVREFSPAADLAQPPITEIVNPVVTLVAAAVRLPSPVRVPAFALQPTAHFDALEPLEGMRVQVDDLVVVAPTLGSVTEARATATSNGVFYGVLPGVGRPMREAGIEVFDSLPAGAPQTIPRWDGNPERLRVDTGSVVGGRLLDVATGMRVRGLVGPLDVQFRTWSLLAEPGASAEGGTAVTGDAVAPARPDEVSVASLNLERFFDTVDDPAVSDVALAADAFAGRLRKASLLLRQRLAVPDLVVLQEVENQTTLERLADAVNADAAAESRGGVRYQAYLDEGNDPGGIDIGMLVNRATVPVVDVGQVGKTDTFVNPRTGTLELLHDRPPLVAKVALTSPDGSPVTITVVGLHLRSLTGVDDPVDGIRVREKRRAQADAVARLVQREQVSGVFGVLLVGDLNAFTVNDGYVDVVGAIRGAPAPPDAVVTGNADVVQPDLAELGDLLPPEDRYSYLFDGTAQPLDHALITRSLGSNVRSMRYVRVNADAPEAWRGDFSRPERVSDHDPLLVRLAGVR